MRVLLTNWINLTGVFIATFSAVFMVALFHSGNPIAAIFAALFSIGLYGIMFWVGFVLALLIIDVIIFAKSKNKLNLKLFIEWFLISSPFIYWMVKYDEWIFVVAVLAFLITQLIRSRLIRKITS